MLENINSPKDLRQLNIQQLNELCKEIRQQLVRIVKQTGGHLSSNLGVVELTVALHYVFDEADKIVWDVGHQSYIHKMLTGRFDKMDTLRTKDGLCGFTDPNESSSDVFVSGHASTSLSSALGLACARDLKGEDYNIVAVLGDGALTGGMIYEALNNIKKTQLLIVLNDNNMSIEKNVGKLAKKISKIRVGRYYRNKQKLKKALGKIPVLGKPTYRFLRWCKRHMKFTMLSPSYFDNFDVKYIGIVDGNELKDLIYYFTKIRNNIKRPTVLHLVTKKGSGYLPAEQNQSYYHNYYVTNDSGKTSSEVVGSELVKLAEKDSNVCAISAAMKESVGLKKFAEMFPDRCFDVGIAEEHAVTFAGGLATGGAKPYVLIYSTFLQRAYDQLVHDTAIPKLPVTFLLDRAGLVGSDGKTHQGIQDISYLSSIPDMTVWTPYCYDQLKDMLRMSYTFNGPLAIRYSKSMVEDGKRFNGSWNILLDNNADIKLLAVGSNMVQTALKASSIVQNLYDINVDVVAVTTIKPLDNQYLSKLSNVSIVTLEENQKNGGFGSILASYFSERKDISVHICAVENKFVEQATVTQQLEACGLSVDSVVEKIKICQ